LQADILFVVGKELWGY